MNKGRIAKAITELAFFALSFLIMKKASIDNMAHKDISKRELEENELWAQLRNAISLRISEDSVLWHIFGIFWAASALLLVALFRSGDFPDNFIVGLIISTVGFSLSIAWFLIQRRSLGHVKRHEKLMERIEQKLGFNPDYAASAEVNLKDYQEFLSMRPRARNVMKAFSIFALIGWSVLVSLFIYRGFAN